MEIISQKNASGQAHGNWTDDGSSKHYLNGVLVGYYSSSCQCHFLNGTEIGCEMWGGTRTQHFYNKLRQRFGEQVRWV